MFRKKRVILALVVIFICGIATGIAVSPTVRHLGVFGNPYSKASIAEHIFFTDHIDWSKFDTAKTASLKSVIDKNVKNYMGALEIFRIESSDIFTDYLADVKPFLTDEEYNSYVKSIDNEQLRRDKRYKTLSKEAGGK